MKQLLLSLLLLCSLGISAQDGVVTRPKKQQTTSAKPKQNSSQKPAAKKQSATKTQPKPQSATTTQPKPQSATTTQPKPQSKPTVPRETASYSNVTLTVNGANYPMVYVQAGTFTMGATSEMEDPWDDEKPTHQVTLTNDYYIGKTEVTQALWKAVMGNNPSEFKGDNLPVEKVSWDDCQTFISKLNSLTGKRFRLPTEAEWEFAARGGNYSNHYQYSGSNKLGDVAWYQGNGGGKTHAVATKQPNELGLYDMSGNVWEWCSDWYGNYSSSSQTNPTGPSRGSYRVYRGGSWFSDARRCRSSIRNFTTLGYGYYFFGLRLVLVP